MRVLVTGANGYMGRHIVPKLCDGGHEVIACDFSSQGMDSRACFINYDLLANANDPALFTKLKLPEVIIHLAWKDGFNHSSPAHLENLHKHYEFIKNMIDSGAKSIAIMGSMHEIGYFEGCVTAETPCNPLSLYGIAKNALRQAVLNYAADKNTGIKWLRAYYITGDDSNNKSIFAKILQMANEGKKSFPFTSGINKYDFLDVNELAEQITSAALQNEICGIINVCSGKPVALKDKVEQFIRDKQLDIMPEYGAFPSRKYDSPAIWGDACLINQIMKK